MSQPLVFLAASTFQMGCHSPIVRKAGWILACWRSGEGAGRLGCTKQYLCLGLPPGLLSTDTGPATVLPVWEPLSQAKLRHTSLGDTALPQTGITPDDSRGWGRGRRAGLVEVTMHVY